MSRRRRRRRDFRAFASEFDKYKDRLEEIVDALDKVWAQTVRRKEEVPERAVVAAVAAVGGGTLAAGILSLARFTGDQSSVAAGIALMATAAVAGAAVAGVFLTEKISDQETVKKVKELLERFLETIGFLKQELVDLKTSLKDSNRDTEDLVRAQTRIQDLSTLLQAFTKESTVERLLEVKEQCSKTLEDLQKIRLSFYDDE